MKLRHRPPAEPAVTPEAPAVRLVLVPPPRSEMEDGSCFLVQDAEGVVHTTGSSSRRAALRQLGGLAMRGLPAPLILLDPDGTPTGDRLA